MQHKVCYQLIQVELQLRCDPSQEQRFLLRLELASNEQQHPKVAGYLCLREQNHRIHQQTVLQVYLYELLHGFFHDQD